MSGTSLNPPPPWLTDAQLEELTKKKRAKSQAEELRKAEIPFRMIGGRPVVLVQSLAPMQQSGIPRPTVKRL
ncbi:DUF4224 domain-containing protein [Microbulbifer epialgicus]|uniref:DUF4224 domain-containing protein n=1 Tax=Microbulbifer epialgicus TaxID=393907 RepID=A0ABV4P291_9GAMM